MPGALPTSFAQWSCLVESPQRHAQLLWPWQTSSTRSHAGAQWKLVFKATLLRAAETAIQTFIQAKFPCTLIKKWQWILHIPDVYQRLGHIPNCFTAERKHKSISAVATRLSKTQDFEKLLLQQVLPHELLTLQEPDLFPSTVQCLKPRAAKKEELRVISQFFSRPPSSAAVASCAVLPTGACCHSKDAIAYRQDDSSLQTPGTMANLVRVWRVVDWQPATRVATVQTSDLQGLIQTDAILFPLVYINRSTTEAKVLLPYQMYYA